MSNRKKMIILICASLLGGFSANAFADNNVVDFPDHALLFPGAAWNNGGVDSVEGRNRTDTIEGGDDADYLYGEIGSDYVAGDLGPDSIEGGPDDDCYCQGNDGGLFANGGDDYIGGNSGNDRLEGGGGSDVLDGGSENDNIYANDGVKDYVDGGPGSGDDCFLDNKDVYQSC